MQPSWHATRLSPEEADKLRSLAETRRVSVCDLVRYALLIGLLR